MSRANYPKQFLDVLGLGRTLIQQTVDRYKRLVPVENIFIVTSAEYVPLVKEQLPEISDKQILAEPYRKNTAACIAYIAYKLKGIDPQASMIAAPADHLVMEPDAFVMAANQAFDFVEQRDALVTIGIKPNHPNTGYGYIQFDPEVKVGEVYDVKTFTEKPNLEMAKTFYPAVIFFGMRGSSRGRSTASFPRWRNMCRRSMNSFRPSVRPSIPPLKPRPWSGSIPYA